MNNELKAFILGIDAALAGSAPSPELWAKVVAEAKRGGPSTPIYPNIISNIPSYNI